MLYVLNWSAWKTSWKSSSAELLSVDYLDHRFALNIDAMLLASALVYLWDGLALGVLFRTEDGLDLVGLLYEVVVRLKALAVVVLSELIETIRFGKYLAVRQIAVVSFAIALAIAVLSDLLPLVRYLFALNHRVISHVVAATL